MEWRDEYSVDVDFIDQQHKQIVLYISEAENLLEWYEKGRAIDKNQLVSLMQRLGQYTARIFVTKKY